MKLTRKAILDEIKTRPDFYDNKKLARALGVKGDDRRELRQLLRAMVEDGSLKKSDRKTFREADALPGVMVIKATRLDDGDLMGEPENWKGDGPVPQLLIRDTGPFQKRAGEKKRGKRDQRETLKVGDRALCRIKVRENGEAVASVMKKLGSGPTAHLGVLYKGGRGWRIQPVSKKARHDYKPVRVPDAAEDQDLVWFKSSRRNQGDMRLAEITEIIGSAKGGKSASLISLHENDIRVAFSDKVIAEAKALKLPKIEGAREDIRDLPLITIDPVDAKDFDDAVFAHPDKNEGNKGGWVVWVAIADVSAFVTPGSELDAEARERGNSVYLPDMVVPMLPHELSSDLCSLRPHEDRACMAVRMVFDKTGTKIKHKFKRGMMRSHARLTYQQAQDASEGRAGDAADPVLDIIQDTYAAYACLKKGRDARAPLAIELPERRVHIDDEGKVSGITLRDRFDAHKLIEEFMVQANVCAAESLIAKKTPAVMRFHDVPSGEKLKGLSDFLPALDMKFSVGERATTARLNKLLAQADAKDLTETVGMAVLRSQSQAVYSADKGGHFGLNLADYTHFTSPIRRYADLIVHRALIDTFDLGDDGMDKESAARLQEIAEHISSTERKAMVAERDAKDRYIAAYLADRVGAVFDARITGVTKFGLFITLDETGADGLIPARNLGREYFAFDEKNRALIGVESGDTYRFGRPIKAKLEEATPITGGLTFEMVSKPEKGKPPKRNHRAASGHKSRGAKHRRKRR
jgi:ribonuclease R